MAFLPLICSAQIYSTGFGTTTSGTPPSPFNPPATIAPNLTSSGWTGGTIFYIGTSGAAYSINTSNGNGTFALTLNVASGYTVNITQLNFQMRRTSNGPTGVAVTVGGNNFTVSGTPPNGSFAAISATGLANNLSGTITINIVTSGGTGSGQNVRLDDFSITGTISSACTAPTTPASTLLSGNITATTADLSWTRGNGDNVLVVARPSTASAVAPASGTSYTANATYGSGSTTGSGNNVVYNGSGTSVSITGLTASTTYAFDVYEYATASTCYLTPAATANFTTACGAPANVTATTATSGNTQVALSWTNPASCYDEILVVAAEAANTGNPSGNGSAYTANATYASGTALGNGFVVYKGTGSSETVTALTNNTTYYFKVYTRSGTTWSTGIEVNAIPALATAANDYFRSTASGNWNNLSTWESSIDNINWIPASLIPDETSAGIYIENGSNVIINTTGVTLDQMVIKTGGTLTVPNSFTLNNGAGDDLLIENGGIMSVSAGYSSSYYNNATIQVALGGKITITGGSQNHSYATNTNNIWDDGSIFEWNNNNTPALTGQTLFPNAASDEIPIFLVTNISSGNIGGSSPTIVYGLLEANANITFGGASRTFRNGIIGTGNVAVQQANTDIIINGATAMLGGTGTIITNTSSGTNGLKIGDGTNPTMVTMTSNKTIDGNLLLQPNGKMTLDAYNLTVTDIVSGGSANSYIVTNGSGALIRDVSTTINSYDFPIGSSSDYQLANITFSSVSGANSLAARFVANAPGNAGLPLTEGSTTYDHASIGGFWQINSSSSDLYDISLTANNFPDIIATSPLTVVKRPNSGSWILDGTPGTATGASSTVTVTRTGLSGFSEFGIGGAAMVSLPISLEYFRAEAKNNETLLTWATLSEDRNKGFDIERSNDGQRFESLGFVASKAENGYSNSKLEYTFSDNSPKAGKNYYRLKQADFDGTFSYSKVAFVNNDGSQSVNVYPNPAVNNVSIDAQGYDNARAVIYNVLGMQVAARQLQNGVNQISVGHLPNGVYNVHIVDAQGNTTTHKIVIQH